MGAALDAPRLALAAVLMALTASATTASPSILCGFIGPAIVPSPATAPCSDKGAAPRKTCLLKAPGHVQGAGSTIPESPLARRMHLKRSRAARPGKPFVPTAPSVNGSDQQDVDEIDSRGAELGNLFRMEVAQRLKEMKIMTGDPGVGPLAAATAPSVAAETPLLERDASALEGQIALLSKRIKSIADYLQTTPADTVSRKGLVVLVKRRRTLLETLRHRNNDRWLAITESLGLRQRLDVTPGEQRTNDARRARRRDRGRRRRADAK